MFRKFGLPLLGLGLMSVAILHVVRAQTPPPQLSAPLEPGRSPFGPSVAGSGTIEAQTENVAVGAPLSGVVAEVFVKVGVEVPAGAPLFRLDDRQLQAELKVREANLATAEAQLARQVSLPRPDELPVKEALVREARERLVQSEDQFRRGKRLFASRAIAEEELTVLEQSCRVAREQLARAEAEYKLLQAGAWEHDRTISQAQVTLARVQAEQTRTELERLQVRAPVDGKVLQVNVRGGEYVGAQPGQGLVVVGNVRTLHVRVQVDERDIPRFRAGAAAYASLRGYPQLRYPLTFVRVEPHVVPKKSLTGEGPERVDTRVLPIIYALEPVADLLHVGQQVDVWIEADR